MKHKSKLFLSILLTAILFSLSACGAINYYNICNSAVNATKHSGEMGTVHNASYTYLTFEEAVTEFATDVVIAQYVGSRPFGNHSTEFEFIVLDRILGNAPERIFVYTLNNLSAHVSGGEYDAEIPFNRVAHPAAVFYIPRIVEPPHLPKFLQSLRAGFRVDSAGKRIPGHVLRDKKYKDAQYEQLRYKYQQSAKYGFPHGSASIHSGSVRK